ncbi:MAG: phage portal protein [Dehalococcoidia bacterium]|jgi:HK97 family phage portal protein
MGLFPSLNEIRTSVAMPEKWLVDWVGGGTDTKSGIRVDEISALNCSAVFNAMSIIGGTMMQLPCHLYKRTKGGGKTRATWHPLYQIVHGRVCPPQKNGMPGMTAARWRQTGSNHLCGWGNFFNYLQFRGDGQVQAIYPLRPDRVKIEEKTGDEYKVEFWYEPKTGPRLQLIPGYNMLYLPGFGYDGIKGYSILALARESIGLGMAAEEFGARFYGSGTHPSVIATAPGPLSAESRKNIQESLTEKWAGLGKSHSLILLEQGITLDRLAVNPNDSQFLETRKFQVTEIARWFNLPPHMLKDLERATFTNIEHQSIEFLTINMGPWIVLWETEMTYGLLRQDEIEAGYFIEFDLNGMLRGDIKTRFEAYAIGRTNGFLNGDDIRSRENMNSMGEDGKKFWRPANMVVVGEAMDKPADAEKQQDKQARDIFIPLLVDAGARVVRREVNDATGAVQKYLERNNRAEFENWITDYYSKFPGRIEENMRPVWTAFGEMLADNLKEFRGESVDSAAFDVRLAAISSDFAHAWARTSMNDILAAVRDSDDCAGDAAAVRALLELWEMDKPRAKAEVNSAAIQEEVKRLPVAA